MRNVIKKTAYLKLVRMHCVLGHAMKSRHRISMSRTLTLIEEMHEILTRYDTWEKGMRE